MTRRRTLLWIGTGLVLAVMVPLVVLSGRSGGAGSSVLSHGRLGWLVAHRYLEERGAVTTLANQPLTGSLVGETDVLVVSFPAQRGFHGEELDILNSFLLGGGTLLYAYSHSEPTLAEQQLLVWLDLEHTQIGGPQPLNPITWWRQAGATWSLEAEGDRAGATPVHLLKPRWLPTLSDTKTDPETDPETDTVPDTVPNDEADPVPDAVTNDEADSEAESGASTGADVLYRGEHNLAVIFSFRQRRGRVVVLPSEVLASSRMHSPGNADLLESLYRWLGDDWLFDEYRHGLSAPVAAAGRTTRRAFDLICLHLMICYLLAVMAMARRLGPPWREQAPVHGSTASFLVGLGRLHDRLGHHRRAAELLLERASELDPGLTLPSLPEPGRGERRALVRLAGRVAQEQTRSNLSTLTLRRDNHGSATDSAD